MSITLYGISFDHRRATAHEYVLGDYAQFGAFAALCNARGIAKYVGSVFFDQNFMGFNIEMNPEFENTPTSREVFACAEASLSQFMLFGTVGHKGGSDL